MTTTAPAPVCAICRNGPPTIVIRAGNHEAAKDRRGICGGCAMDRPVELLVVEEDA